MHPICFSIGPVTIHWYGVMMALGFLAGLANWAVLGKREGRDLTFCSDLLFWIMISSIVGARLAYVLANIRDFVAEPASIVRVDQGGLIYYGGFFGVMIALTIFARLHRERLLVLMDFVAPSVPLAHAFGRIGCLLNGCCFGAPWEGVFSIRYPHESSVWWHQFHEGLVFRRSTLSLPVHPVQVYEALFNLALWGVLVWAYRRRQRDGETAALYLLAYPVGRFLLEFMRGDERLRCLGLSVAQLVSLTLLIAGIAILWVARRSGFRPWPIRRRKSRRKEYEDNGDD